MKPFGHPTIHLRSKDGWSAADQNQRLFACVVPLQRNTTTVKTLAISRLLPNQSKCLSRLPPNRNKRLLVCLLSRARERIEERATRLRERIEVRATRSRERIEERVAPAPARSVPAGFPLLRIDHGETGEGWGEGNPSRGRLGWGWELAAICNTCSFVGLAVSSRNPTALNVTGLVMLGYGIHPPNPTYKILIC